MKFVPHCGCYRIIGWFELEGTLKVTNFKPLALVSVC